MRFGVLGAVEVRRDTTGDVSADGTARDAAAGGTTAGDDTTDDAVPSDAVPSDAVPSDAVPGDAVPGVAITDDAITGGTITGDITTDDAIAGGAITDGGTDGRTTDGALADGAIANGALAGGALAGGALGGGEAVPVGGPLVRALLAMLALEAGRTVPAARLIDGLYGEDPPRGAGNALQSQVSRLRRGLGGAALVEGGPVGYRLAVDPEAVDVHRFGRLAREGRAAAGRGEHTRAAGLLRAALGLWRGPALAGVDAPFAAARAVRLEEERAAAVEEYGAAALASGTEPGGALAELRALVDERPLRERARALLVRALHAAGRRAEALAVFEEGRRLLADELGADPSPELAAAHLAVLRGEPSAGPSAGPSAPPAGPASVVPPPAQLTSFVGREDAVRHVGTMLAAGRLVTLLGPGGAGKTRLAVEAAAREDGEVCFVDLAPVGRPDVERALLAALGLRENAMRQVPGERPGDAAQRLVAALAGRAMLLVLDNCEHVVAQAAGLARRLLSACPRLRVLATSREVLAVTGEAVWPLPPLALPPAGTPPEELAEYPAVRLFADRARAVRPGFAVDGTNAAAVLRICAAMDGLPLAIELAAARLRSLPVGEVAARLDDRFRLLTRGDRTAAPRHRTLRAVVEWSWSLLGPAERTLARRLTVFAGGFTAAAAAAVCGPGDADEALAELVDKSLVQLESHGDGGRYRMLDTIRAFCAERLAAAGEAERLRRAHADWSLDLALRADRHLRTADQLEWLDRLAADHANLHAALRRCVESGDTVRALRLIAALSWYWWLRGRVEGAPPATALLGRIGTDPPPGLEEEYVLCVCNVVSAGGTGAEAAAWMDRAEEVLAGVRRLLAFPATTVLWAMTAGPGRTREEIFREQIGDDPWTRALLDMSEGFLNQFSGDRARAEERCAAALAAFRAVGDRWGMANSIDPFAQLADWRGDRATALELLGEALELTGELGALEDTADLLCRRGEIRIRGGDPAGARADFERAAELARRAGTPDKVAAALHGLGELARLGGDHAEARRLYETALTEYASDRFIVVAVRGATLVGLGRLALADGDARRARELFDEAAGMVRDHPLFAYRADAAVGMAALALAEDDGERAAVLLGVAAAVRGARIPGDHDAERAEASARARLGDAAFDECFAKGAALPAREDARTLFVRRS
ncbi:ATP-binding protein [Actinomadura algeriensis]|uniref:ATPase/DNA-binding SARP family transcriptional activator n=1 Tax=Actinomadura algeriensis TaxID=1679523 RepID=A0ABR9K440_9ACTN|nr:BTAD domain-containing putative transcriptional regulator [Actinomadura algeriensis]MBE1537363.1 putative ATPase/DNA-binding SARP family transcriptional activator [Actinomadura algeriensis]